MIFAPFFFIYLVLFFVAIAFLFAMIEIGIIRYAFAQIGLPPEAAFLALVASLIGSYINIPIYRLEGGEAHPAEVVNYYGVRYRLPVRYASNASNSTMLAVNVGGALVPMLIVIYLLSHRPAIFGPAMIATAVVAFIANRFARPIPGLGIAMPMFIPPITAAVAAYLLAPNNPSAVAYISGVIGP